MTTLKINLDNLSPETLTNLVDVFAKEAHRVNTTSEWNELNEACHTLLNTAHKKRQKSQVTK